MGGGGYVGGRRGEGGRGRRRYRITAKGRRALREWAAEPTADFTELRDPGLLKLFFGADPKRLAPPQLDAHRAKLAEYEAIHASMKQGSDPAGPRLALEAGFSQPSAGGARPQRPLARRPGPPATPPPPPRHLRQ